MKVLVNGGLNFSELDGWWAEAYSSEVAGSGDGLEHGDDPAVDGREADQLYTLLDRKLYRSSTIAISRESLAGAPDS